MGKNKARKNVQLYSQIERMTKNAVGGGMGTHLFVCVKNEVDQILSGKGKDMRKYSISFKSIMSRNIPWERVGRGKMI